MAFGRPQHLNEITNLFNIFHVVGLIGARQVGKTTLAQLLAARVGLETATYDMEDPRVVVRLANPMTELERHRGLVILDEIQHRPELFPALRVLADRPSVPARFLVLGSASPELLRQSSESLAGRIAYHELGPLDLEEVGTERHATDQLWLRGGFPRSFLAETDAQSALWRAEFIRTYLERDLASLGFRTSALTMRRFWMMLAHLHGQVWNASQIASSLGVTEKTTAHYLDVLCATFTAFRLRPWFENAGKRVMKSPKVFIADPGLLHALLDLPTLDALRGHPKAGASFEGFVVAQLIRRLRARPEQCFFWGLHSGAELDLLIVQGDRRRGFEIKLTEAPSMTRSMNSAMEHLHLDTLDVVHAGPYTFSLEPKVRAVALEDLLTQVNP